MTELVIKLRDDSKLEALLNTLRRFTASEGVDLAVDSLERRTVIEPAQSDFDWERWDAIVSRDKRLPGQTEMAPQEEEEWIAARVMEMRAEDRVQQATDLFKARAVPSPARTLPG